MGCMPELAKHDMKNTHMFTRGSIKIKFSFVQQVHMDINQNRLSVDIIIYRLRNGG